MKRKLKVNDFFCGCGGMGIAFKNAGYEIAGAYAKAKERKDKAKKRVNELFGSGAEKPVAEDVVNLLIATVDAIEDKHMK